MTLPAPRDIGVTGQTASVGFVLMSSLPFEDIIGSTVLAATVGGVLHNTPFSDTAARMRFNLTAATGDQVKDVNPCVFWDEIDADWNATGCKHLRTDGLVVMCECNHLTTFAVLTDANVGAGAGSGLSEEEQHNLAWFVIVCVGISIACLTVVILVYAVFSELRTEAKIILLHLCSMYNLALILFLATATGNFEGDGCIAVGAALHFALLSTFLWMLVEGRHLHQTFVNVFSQRRAQEGRQLALYCSVAYGAPAFEVLLLVLVWPAAYERDYGLCFLSKNEGAIWFFLGPALLVIALNAYVLVQVSREVWGIGVVNKSDSSTAEIIGKTKRAAKASLVFGSILGITWVFGLLSLVVPDSLVFNYFFAICNALGGLWIFAFHLLKDPEASKKLRSSVLGVFMGSSNGKKKPQKQYVNVVRRKKGSVETKFTGAWSGPGTGTDSPVSTGGTLPMGSSLSVPGPETAEAGLAEASLKPASPPAPPQGGNDYAEYNSTADARNGYVDVQIKQASDYAECSPVVRPTGREPLKLQMDSSGGAYSVGSVKTEENDYSVGSALEDDTYSISSAPDENDHALGSTAEENDDSLGQSAPEANNYSAGTAPEVPPGSAPDERTNRGATSSPGDTTQSLTNATYAIGDNVGIGGWIEASTNTGDGGAKDGACSPAH